MVKRAKLTLEHTEVNEVDFPESAVNEQSAASDSRGNLGKMLLMAGLTIASLIIFKQKIF
ncbi:MAG: hypothetical protein KZQ83_03080 [gamma proteobacterium symbiont of Taylorina sp.]|nr:hypothetical protein [gamma proteobacterium symbiont of Taylorina sp.]